MGHVDSASHRLTGVVEGLTVPVGAVLPVVIIVVGLRYLLKRIVRSRIAAIPTVHIMASYPCPM
jgi:4-amino-4-deoxy-L-arabinose transferase-like glycosyltransferase